MAKTPSQMIPLGTKAPDFVLPDAVSGRDYTLDELRGERGTLVMFTCNHCPFVRHIEVALSKLGLDYADSGIGIVAISANDVETFPDDHPEKMKEKANGLGYAFPYLYDESQDVARTYDAACTPDFFLFDSDLKCVYRGQFDDSRPGNDVPITGADLRGAMDALIAGEAISDDQKPSVGCNIKWKT